MNTKEKLLDPIGNKSIVEVIINRITASIISGELKKGSKIPTEKELSENLDVARNSVREAIKVLVYLGVLEIRHPKGTFVAEGFSDKMLNPILYSLIIEDGQSNDLVELRSMFEVNISNNVIKRATEQDIACIQNNYNNLISLLEKRGNDYGDISKADEEFHMSMAKATHNSLLNRLYTVVTMLTHPTRLKTIQRLIDEGNYQYLIESHKMIWESIKRKDNHIVIEAVENSFLYWKESL